jgi:alpha-tubulin suppressor-like RCC1 family protein
MQPPSSAPDPTRARPAAPVRLVPVLCAAILAAACQSNDTGPGAGATVRLVVTVPVGDSSLVRVLGLETARLTVVRSGGAVALDSVTPLAPGVDSVVVEASVVLQSTGSANGPAMPLELTATLADAAGDSVFVAGPDTVQVRAGDEPHAVRLLPRYVGVGRDAAEVRIRTADTSAYAGMTLVLTTTVWNAVGSPIVGTPLIWTSLDPAVATVPRADSGRIVIGATPGTARIVTRLPTGPADTATVHVAADLVFTAVVAATYHSCGLTTGGAAYCWGDNAAGQLGVGRTVSGSAIPIAVAEDLSFATITAAGEETCGVTTGGAAYCWGTPLTAIEGSDTTWTPAPFASGLAFKAISLGLDPSCGLTADGAAYCWGSNGFGQLGDSLREYDSAVPVPVAGGLAFSTISVGPLSACGVTTAGAGQCWGLTNSGQLGIGADTGSSPAGAAGFSCVSCRAWPVPVVGGLTFQTINRVGLAACGLTTDGSAYCWGSNNNGQLGTGTTTGPETCGGDTPQACSTRPVPVTGGVTFARLSERGSCGVTTAGAVYCWGNGAAWPVQAGTGGLTFTLVDQMEYSTTPRGCGIATNGFAYCWGDNAHGQLGDGSLTSSNLPVRVAGQP